MSKKKRGSPGKQNRIQTRVNPDGSQQYVRGRTPIEQAETTGRVRGTIRRAHDDNTAQLRARRRSSPDFLSRSEELIGAGNSADQAFLDELRGRRGMKSGGPVCRGMGKASRGGRYGKSG